MGRNDENNTIRLEIVGQGLVEWTRWGPVPVAFNRDDRLPTPVLPEGYTWRFMGSPARQEFIRMELLHAGRVVDWWAYNTGKLILQRYKGYFITPARAGAFLMVRNGLLPKPEKRGRLKV